jgi:hypothetical protein
VTFRLPHVSHFKRSRIAGVSSAGAGRRLMRENGLDSSLRIEQ